MVNKAHPRIIVPLNETSQSERALPVAVEFARRLHTSLVLVSVVEWPNAEHPGHPGYHESQMEPYADLEAESVVVKTKGDRSSAIRSICLPSDIICIGADHVSAVAEIMMNSTFFDLVRDFHGPVVAVGPHAEIPPTATRVLVCVDGRPHAEESLDLIPRLIEPAGLEPFLVQVLPESAAALHLDTPESNYLRELARHNPELGINGWDVLHGDPSKAIALYAHDPRVAAIAFMTDAIDAVGRIVSPSLANELIGKATRPLVLIGSTNPVTVTRHLIAKTAKPA